MSSFTGNQLASSKACFQDLLEWIWSSLWSRASLAPLPRRYSLSALTNVLSFIKMVGKYNTTSSMLALGIVSLTTFWQFYHQTWVVFPPSSLIVIHAGSLPLHLERYLDLFLSLSPAPSSLILFLTNPSFLGFPELQALSFRPCWLGFLATTHFTLETAPSQ